MHFQCGDSASPRHGRHQWRADIDNVDAARILFIAERKREEDLSAVHTTAAGFYEHRAPPRLCTMIAMVVAPVIR